MRRIDIQITIIEGVALLLLLRKCIITYRFAEQPIIDTEIIKTRGINGSNPLINVKTAMIAAGTMDAITVKS